MILTYTLKPIPRSVFRAYDIRGIIGDALDESSYYQIGKAIACRLYALARETVYVAQDGRLTSPSLTKALIEGLLESGISVIDLGVAPTPVMYFATNMGSIDSGLMVTGSHNPADYNGIKMVLAGKSLVQEDIDILYNTVQQGQYIEGVGHYSQQNILARYKARVVSDIVLQRPLKVVVDAGNGVAGPIIPEVLAQLGCDVIPLFCDIDGRFPNHHPDPTIEENLDALKEAVLAHGADIGLALDGDADRLGVVTNTGEMIFPDRLMIMYAKDVLSRNSGAAIVYDVKCTHHLKNAIDAMGGRALMCPTGHSIVKGVMREENALLAGEMSGHLFFKERWYGFDDAIYSACRLLEIISQSIKSASDQFQEIPNSINTPEIKIPIDDKTKFEFMEKFCEQADFPEGRRVTIDGLRVEFDKGWGLLRASNTTPCLVARFEADDEASLQQIQEAFFTQIKRLS